MIMFDESMFVYYGIKFVMNILIGSPLLWLTTKILKFKETGFEKALTVNILFFAFWGLSGWLFVELMLSTLIILASFILLMILLPVLIKLAYKEGWGKTVGALIIFSMLCPTILFLFYYQIIGSYCSMTKGTYLNP